MFDKATITLGIGPHSSSYIEQNGVQERLRYTLKLEVIRHA